MSAAIDAFHLPGLRSTELQAWDTHDYDDGAVRLRVPRLTPAALEQVLARLRESRARHLARLPVRELVLRIDAAAQRLAARDAPERGMAEELLPRVTGYTRSTIQLVLDHMVRDWQRAPLEELLAAELGDARALDQFVPHGTRGRATRAFGPELAFHIFAGNVPGVAVTSLVRALLVKAASFGKTATGEPLLPVLFAQALAHVAPELGDCLAVTYWPGGTAELESVALAAADTIIVYGGEEVEREVRRRVPAGKRMVVHGPRVSFAAVARERLEDEQSTAAAAAAAALAVATFDQQGCVSPHVVYVEAGARCSPPAFAERLARELGRLERELPRGALTPAESATIQQVRGAAEFRALGGADVRLHASRGTEYTVIYDADATFVPSCLNRLVWVKPLAALEEIVELVRPFGPLLQTVGVAADAARVATIAEALGALGASRVAPLERMPWPPASWHHDGAGPLRELVRWVDLEGEG